MKKVTQMFRKMQSIVKNQKGATMVEYALMAALIAVVCIGAVTAIGKGSESTFNKVKDSLPAAAAPAGS